MEPSPAWADTDAQSLQYRRTTNNNFPNHGRSYEWNDALGMDFGVLTSLCRPMRSETPQQDANLYHGSAELHVHPRRDAPGRLHLYCPSIAGSYSGIFRS